MKDRRLDQLQSKVEQLERALLYLLALPGRAPSLAGEIGLEIYAAHTHRSPAAVKRDLTEGKTDQHPKFSAMGGSWFTTSDRIAEHLRVDEATAEEALHRVRLRLATGGRR